MSTEPFDLDSPESQTVIEKGYGKGYEDFRNKWIGDHEPEIYDLVTAFVPRTRETELQAEIERLKKLLTIAAEALTPYADGAKQIIRDYGNDLPSHQRQFAEVTMGQLRQAMMTKQIIDGAFDVG